MFAFVRFGIFLFIYLTVGIAVYAMVHRIQFFSFIGPCVDDPWRVCDSRWPL